MGALYVDRQGCSLTWRDGALELRLPDHPPRCVPAALLDRVVLRADTTLSSATLAALADAGVSVVAFGGRGGQRVAHLLGAGHGDARARIAQCQRVGDEAWAAPWVRRIVRGRVRAQQRLLMRAQAERADLRKPLHDALATLANVVRALPQAAERAALRGLEGAAAAAFFRGYATLFAPSLNFSARRRRPPPDPVNASLSLGYTLLHAQAVQACWAAGLDPMVGFLHSPVHGRASLACDLMEPWRSEVEQFTWQQFRTGSLRAEHFGADGTRACLLGKAGRSHFYRAAAPMLARCAVGLRRHSRLVARELAASAVVPDHDGWDSDDALPPLEPAS